MHIRYLARLVEPLPGLFTAPKPLGVQSAENIQLSTFNSPQRPQSFEIIKQNPYRPDKVNTLANARGISSQPAKAEAQDKETPKAPVAAAATDGALFAAIVAGKAADAEAATKAAIEAGSNPKALIDNEMIRAMSEVGRQFSEGTAFVPQLLMAGRAMKSALALLKPLMAGQATSSKGKVVIGTVKGDLHDIGKNLVASMLEGCGFEVINIGIDVDADTFINNIREHAPDILCMSALLTTTMTYMKEVIEAVCAAGLRDKVKIMVGGAPVSEAFSKEIGADGYSDDANAAVALAESLMKE
ncbi:MAG: corrinoid protein [Oscillospiraceae bacterium]|nr:corrinoid protein [Oscillospiraceae bacterium]